MVNGIRVNIYMFIAIYHISPNRCRNVVEKYTLAMHGFVNTQMYLKLKVHFNSVEFKERTNVKMVNF